MLTMDNGYRFEDFGLKAKEEHDHPLLAEIERKTKHIPGRPGDWDFGTEIKTKPFSVPMSIMKESMNDTQKSFNDFVDFITDDFGMPRAIKIIFDYEPDKFYMVKLSAAITPDRKHVKSDFALNIDALNPYKYSNTFADEVTWGSEIITFEYNYLLGREGIGGSEKITGPQTLNIPVVGLAVQPIFEIEGSANNLTINANGHSFRLPNFTNTKWTIDFEKYLVYKNGKETMIEIREFYLLPGDNQVKISGSNINIDMRIKYRDKFN